MKNNIRYHLRLIFLIGMVFLFGSLKAQDETKVPEESNKPARKAFGSPVLIDNQTDVVNIAKTLEWNIQHRFGPMSNGVKDLYGIFASSNIRLGFDFTPMNRLAIGFGLSKIIISNPTWDLNIKYKILQQAQSNGSPVNITYFGNMAGETGSKPIYARSADLFEKQAYRLSYFHELIISRRFSSKFSVQVAPMVAHYNSVDSLYSNDIFGVNLGAKLSVSPQGSIIFEWTQPLNKHDLESAGPKPNIALGYEIVTSSHAFQFFISTYRDLLPQNNLAFNTNTMTKDVGGDKKLSFLVGFNLTRLWNF